MTNTASTTDSPFTLRLDGSVVLYDEDGETSHYLPPHEALALVDFVEKHRQQIDAAAGKARTVRAYADLAAGVAAGLPVPTSARTRWDGRLLLDLDQPGAFDAWAACTPGEATVDEHSTLGRRRGVRNERLLLQSDWDHEVGGITSDADKTAAQQVNAAVVEHIDIDVPA